MLFQRTIRQVTWSTGRNTVDIWATAPLSNLSIPVETIQAEKVSLSDIQHLVLFVNPFTANDKNFLLNRGNLLQHFQMHLSQKRKFFLAFLPDFLNLDSILKNFKKKDPSYLMYFWFYGRWKNWLDKCLKSPVSEDPSTSNMVNGSNRCGNLSGSIFIIFIDPCETNSGLKSLSA